MLRDRGMARVQRRNSVGKGGMEERRRKENNKILKMLKYNFKRIVNREQQDSNIHVIRKMSKKAQVLLEENMVYHRNTRSHEKSKTVLGLKSVFYSAQIDRTDWC